MLLNHIFALFQHAMGVFSLSKFG